MTQEDNEIISAAMTLLGRRRSPRKRQAGQANIKKAQAASVTPEARQRRSEAAKAVWAARKAAQEAKNNLKITAESA